MTDAKKRLNSQEFAQTVSEEMITSRSFWADARRRFLGHRLAVFSIFMLLALLLFAIFGHAFAQWSYEEIDWNVLGRIKTEGGPNWENGHYFGVDELGRDLFARVVQGSRTSLMVGFVAGPLAVLLGATLGALAGYFGGRLDQFIVGFYTIWISIPYIIFFVVWQAFFGRSLTQMILVIILVNWTAGLLIVRGQVMMLKNREFVDAARMLGMSDFAIIFKHLAPNILWVIVIYTSIVIPEVIMAESLVSFLGVGIQEPNTSWGALISEGAKTMTFGTLWQLGYPAAFFVIAQVSLYYIGDGLRDALDPKDRR
ncbi:ABC transporter permease [Antarctobacter heliothermus]|uniref:Oligopeptide transport system permease protein OppC n=1 Tax=Antarctobacter heliothermus TaxID=74033 RepID=A0A239IHB7_9RHOB|nr:ABC transporter permease [Antarctobacter heliothermus]SNS93116.1 oligopeptide transport system permease protein [Antarctobacter heliothermus]